MFLKSMFGKYMCPFAHDFDVPWIRRSGCDRGGSCSQPSRLWSTGQGTQSPALQRYRHQVSQACSLHACLPLSQLRPGGCLRFLLLMASTHLRNLCAPPSLTWKKACSLDHPVNNLLFEPTLVSLSAGLLPGRGWGWQRSSAAVAPAGMPASPALRRGWAVLHDMAITAAELVASAYLAEAGSQDDEGDSH